MAPKVCYARRDDLHVAYAVIGDGPIDVVFVPGFVSHLNRTLDPEKWATASTWLERLARFARVITFDKIGTGLSDRSTDIPRLEDRMDDVRAVMDAVGSERAALVGVSEGGPMSILFAATFPERVHSLTLYGAYATSSRTDDHPWVATAEERAAMRRCYRTNSAMVRSVSGPPATSNVVAMDSRQPSRSSLIFSFGPIRAVSSMSAVGTAAAASSLWPAR